MSALALDKVCVQFTGEGGQTVQALKDVDCHMASGDFTVALGASGCGKTTLLKLLAGFITPTSGDVLIDGVPIDGPGPDRGVVFQKNALLPWLNVIDNVGFGPKLAGKSKREARDIARRYLAMVELAHVADQRAYKLSGGMQQRVGLARALANDPGVLLMDEPLGALDALTRETIQSLILDIWADTKKTVFFITHSVEEALFMGNRLLIMSPSPGRVIESRTFDFCHRYLASRDARQVKADPAFVAAREEILDMVRAHSAAE